MTFYEAAIEVLFKAGRPLHYKKITEAAIQENLLSHVGKTPEITMGERLNQEIKKQDESPVVSVRPGVYALREEFIKKLQAEPHLRPQRIEPAPVDEEVEGNGADAADAVEDEEETDAQAQPTEGRQGARRRRRRSGRNGSDRNGGGRASAEVAAVESADVAATAAPAAVASAPAAVAAPRATPTPEADERSARRDGRRKDAGPAASAPAVERPRDVVEPVADGKHLTQGPVRLDGIAEAAYTVLKDSDQTPMKVQELADEIFRRKLVRFHTHDAATTVTAAIANDIHMRRQYGHRPLFVQYDLERWGLTEWGFSASSVRREQQILSLAEEIRQDTINQLGESLLDCKAEAVEHLVLTLLERMSYRNIKVSKRSSDGDVFFTGDWRQGLSDIRVCIQVVGDTETELGAEAVTELRSTLHHYAASEGVVMHLGAIGQAAIKESREERLAPITLIDRKTFVELLIRHGIGVRTYELPITMVDMTFIANLSE